MPDATEFLKDSLFCEYAYVINLDKKQLDLFVGFQREKQETPNPPVEDPSCSQRSE